MSQRRQRFGKEELDAERDLIQRVLRLERRAIDKLVGRMQCVPRILAAQNKRLGSPLDEHELADVVQDTLVALWKKLGTFEGRAPLESWVYRASILELMNAARRKTRRKIVGELEHENIAEPEQENENPWNHEELYRGLDRLPEKDAVVIRLKHFEDLTLDQIAESLELPPSTVRSRYYRGLARLEEILVSREKERA